jgi:hypothetical protein
MGYLMLAWFGRLAREVVAERGLLPVDGTP